MLSIAKNNFKYASQLVIASCRMIASQFNDLKNNQFENDLFEKQS